MEEMKIVTKQKEPVKPVYLHLKREIVDKLDELAKKHNKSRQGLINAILEKALKDKSLVIELP